MPAALAVNWPEIRRAVEAGMTYPDAAEKWGIADPVAIRMRASRERWLTRDRIIATATKLQQGATIAELAPRNKRPAVTAVTAVIVTESGQKVSIQGQNGTVLPTRPPETALQAIAADWVSRQHSHREQMQRITAKMMQQAESMPVEINTVADVAAVQKMARLNLGLASVETAVQANIIFPGLLGESANAESCVDEPCTQDVGSFGDSASFQPNQRGVIDLSDLSDD